MASRYRWTPRINGLMLKDGSLFARTPEASRNWIFRGRGRRMGAGDMDANLRVRQVLATQASEYYNDYVTVQSFRDLLSKRPFVPFCVVMSSGEKYEIRHPEMAFLTRTALYIGQNPDQTGIAEDARIVSLLHVTTVETLNGKNGKRRKT
jgi:hypothetical protein